MSTTLIPKRTVGFIRGDAIYVDTIEITDSPPDVDAMEITVRSVRRWGHAPFRMVMGLHDAVEFGAAVSESAQRILREQGRNP